MDKDYTEEKTIQKMKKDYTRSNYTKKRLHYIKEKLHG